MANGYLNPFRDADTFQSSLMSALERYGGGEANVQPLMRYVPGVGWQEVPKQYYVSITHPEAKGGEWRGVMSGAENRTLLVEEGIGFRHYLGEVKPSGPEGIITEPGEELGATTPYYSGVESFARRVSAALYSYSKQPEKDPSRRTVNQLLTRINQLRTGSRPKEYTGMGGQSVGPLPAQPAWYSQEEATAQRLRHMSYRYLITGVAGSQEEIASGLRRQLQASYIPATVPVGGDYEGLAKFFRGGVFGEAGTQYLITTGAFGEPYGREGEMARTAAVTETPLKHKHIGGLRPNPQLWARSEKSMVPLEAPGYYEPQSVTDRANDEATLRGLNLQAIVPMGQLPIQSGMGQLNLPAPLREQLVSQGQSLWAGNVARAKIYMTGANIKQIAEAGLTVNERLIGKPLKLGGQVQVGTFGTGEEATPLNITIPNKQQLGITGYSLHISPEEMNTKTKRQNIEIWAKSLGITIEPTLEASEKPFLAVNMASLAEPAIKSDAFKLQIDQPALYADYDKYYRMKTSIGYLPYNLLGETKSYEALMWSSMKAMPTTGENNLYDFMRALFPEAEEGITAYQEQLAGGVPSRVGFAKATGMPTETGVELLREAAVRAYQYNLSSSEIDIDRNAMLLMNFRVGRIGGEIPIQQFTKRGKQQYIDLAVRGLMAPTIEGGPGMSREEAEARVNEQFIWHHRGRGVYDLRVNVPEAIYTPVHQGLVPEQVGTASTQGIAAMSLQREGMGDMVDFLLQNETAMFQATPDVRALRNVQTGFQYTQAGEMPDPTSVIRVGRGGVDPQDVINLQRSFEGMNDYERLRALGKGINVLAGRSEQEPLLPIHFVGAKTTLAHPLDWAEIETTENQVLRDITLGETTGSFLSTKVLPHFFQLATAEAIGQEAPMLRRKALTLQEQYMKSELLFKRQGGGGFSHATMSGLMLGYEELVSPLFEKRLFNMMGGRAGRESLLRYDEGRRFIRSLHGSPAYAERPPNVATMAVQPKRTISSTFRGAANWLGRAMSGAWKSSGLAQPELVASLFETASQIDADKDPRFFVPLMFGERVGGKTKWQRFVPPGTQKGEYEAWLSRIKQRTSPEEQINSMISYYGEDDKFMAQMPLFERIQNFFSGGGAPKSTATMDIRSMDEYLAATTRNKEVGMGKVYNTYRRRAWASAVSLGAPDIWTAGAIDAVAAKEYSEAVDMRYIQKFWDTAMGSAGFLVGNTAGFAGLPVLGMYKSEGQEGGYLSGRLWEPIDKNIGRLTSSLAQWLGTQEGISPMGLAGMMMDIPEWKPGGMTRQQYAYMLEQEQRSIAGELEPLMGAGGIPLTSKINELVESGRFSERSLGVHALLTRATEYGSRNAQEALIAATRQNPIQLGAYGENLQWQDVEEIFKPTSMIYDFLLGRKGTGEYRSLPNVASLLSWSRDVGSAKSYVMRQFWQSWGQAYTPPWEGEPGASTEDISRMRRSYNILESETMLPWRRVENIAMQIQQARGDAVQPSELAYGGRYTGPSRAGVVGTRAHTDIEAYLRSQGVETEMRTSGGYGLTGGRVDIPYWEHEGKIGFLDIKTGRTPPESFLSQLAIYNRDLNREFAGVVPVNRERYLQIRKEELMAARREAPREGRTKEAQLRIGERIWNESIPNLITYPSEMLNPGVVEKDLLKLAEKQNIQIDLEQAAAAQAAPVERQLPANVPIRVETQVTTNRPQETQLTTGGPPTGGGGGGGGGDGGGGGGKDEWFPIQLLDEEGKPTGQQARLGATTNKGRNLLDVIGASGLGVAGAQGAAGQTGGAMPYRYANYPKSVGQVQGKFEELRKALSQIAVPTGEGASWEQMAPGEIMEEFERLSEVVAEAFPEEQAKLLKSLPKEQLFEALIGMQGYGVDIGQRLKKGRVGNLLSRFFKIQRLATEVSPFLSYTDAQPWEKALIGAIGGFPSDQPGFSAEGGLGLGKMTGIFQSLESLTSIRTGGEAMKPSDVTIHKEYSKALDAASNATKNFIMQMEPFKKMVESSGKEIKLTEENLSVFADTLKTKMVEAISAGQPGLIKTLDTFMSRQKAMGEAATAVAEEFGLGEVAAGGRLTRAQLRAARAASYESGLKEQIQLVDEYAVAQQQFDETLVAALGGGGRVGGGTAQEKNLGMLGRRMLGGFGLMYLRSVAGVMTGGTQYGYAEGIEQRRLIEASMGARFGGVTPAWAPEEEQRRAAAAAGGFGWAGLQQLGTGARRQFGTAASMAQAGLGAYALASWMGTMVEGTSLGFLAAPAAAPIMAGAAALGVGALTAYGAAQQPELTGVGLARGLYGVEKAQAEGRPYIQRLGAIAAGAFSEAWAGRMWAEVSGAITGDRRQAETMEKVKDLMLEIKSAEGQGLTPFEYLNTRQDLTAGERKHYAGLYANWKVTEYPTIPVEGLMQAYTLQGDYGMRLSGAAYGTFASGLGQGIPYEQTALNVAYAPGATFTEIRERAASLMQDWATRGGLTAEDIARLDRGGDRYQRLGVFAPKLPAGQREYPVGRYPTGTYAAVTGTRPIYTQEAYTAQLGELGNMQYELMAQQARIAEQFKLAGFQYEFPQIQQYQGAMTPEIYAERYRMAYPNEIRAGAIQQWRQAAGQLGVFNAPGSFDINGAATTADILQSASQYQFGLGLAQNLVIGGMEGQRAQLFGRTFGAMAPQQSQLYQGMAQGNPLAFGRWAQLNPLAMQDISNIGMTLPGRLGTNVPLSSMFYTDVNAQGQLTGMQWGTSSLAVPGLYTSQQMGAELFGAGWESSPAARALVEGGQIGLQRLQTGINVDYQRAQAGFNLQRIALQREYQPQFWSIEDRQRQLGYEQQEWQFGFQERQMEMQNRFWEQNFALQQQQVQKQRGWSREDWQYQDTVRNLQWGWHVEDFGEQVRFMTGRDRRLAERQMRRDVIMHGLEGDQIDKQRARQEEIWQMEDKRFDIQRQQHEEAIAMQEEQLAKSREFYEQRKALEEESVQLQRKYWEDNMRISEEAARSSAAYAEAQADIAEKSLLVSERLQQISTDWTNFNENSLNPFLELIRLLDPAFADIFETISSGLEAFDPSQYNDPEAGGGTTTEKKCPICKMSIYNHAVWCPRKDDTDPDNYQRGGTVRKGMEILVGEMGPEKIVMGGDGYVVPSYRLNPWEKEQMFFGDSGGSKTVHMILNVGGYQLAELVTDIVDKEIDV